jgi:hypothetical protein
LSWADEVLGLIEQAMGQVVRGAELALAGDGRGEGGGGGRVTVTGGQAGEGQIAFGPQHGGQVPGLPGGEQGEQLADGDRVTEVMSGAGGQWPRPPQEAVADPEGVGVSQRGPGVAQRVPRFEPGGADEGLHHGDHRFVLGILAGARVLQPSQRGPGRGGVTTHHRQPGPVAGQQLIASQRVRAGGRGKFGLGGVPVAEHDQRLGHVDDRDGQGGPVAGPAQVPGGGPGRLGR